MTIKPTLRKNIYFVAALHEVISIEINALLARQDIYPFQTCINCKHFDEPSEQCTKWNTKPPARVIAFGCQDHREINSDLDSDIPF